MIEIVSRCHDLSVITCSPAKQQRLKSQSDSRDRTLFPYFEGLELNRPFSWYSGVLQFVAHMSRGIALYFRQGVSAPFVANPVSSKPLLVSGML